MTSTRPKPFVFVAMPLDAALDDLYLLGIKAAGEAVGAFCERVDEQIFVENILSRIYTQISKADIVVAEMTDRNPNVFYEVGYAHALGKPVVLLTRTADDIPFDLKHYPHVIHGGRIGDLRARLEERLSWLLANPGELPQEHSALEFSIFGTSFHEEKSAVVRLTSNSISPLKFTLDVHNPTDRVFDAGTTELGLVVPKWALDRFLGNAVVLPGTDQDRMLVFSALGVLNPKGWRNVLVELFLSPRALTDRVPCELRVFSRSGFRAITFGLEFRKRDP